MRVDVPPGIEPISFVATEIGSPKLREMRKSEAFTRFVNDSTLTPREREAPRAYLAAEVACSFCTGVRPVRDIPGFSDADIEEDFYANILGYESWDGYTTRERLAIDFCRRFMADHRALSVDDAFWSMLSAAFTTVELEDLCILAAQMDGSSKVNDVLIGIKDTCSLPAGRQIEPVGLFTS